MRVILISHGFQPVYEAGFANGLARNGVAVELVSSDRTLTRRLDRRVVARNLRGSQDRSRPAWSKLLNLLRYYCELFIFLLFRPGVPVHMIGLFALNKPATWSLEILVYRLLRHRLIMTVHNVVPHDRDTPAIRMGLRRAYALPSALVTHTCKAKDRLMKEFGVARERIAVMEHGIDEIASLTTERIARERATIGILPDERLVVFFGSVLPYKGVDLLLDAAKQFGETVRVLIAGHCGDVDYGERLREQMRTHPLGGRIVWQDRYLDEDEVTSIFAAADVIAMPYREIDQSGVLFTALRHGVPVVAFDVGSLRDYLSEKVGRVVPMGDVEGFASAVMEVEPARRVRDEIQQQACQYLWENTVRPMLEYYEA